MPKVMDERQVIWNKTICYIRDGDYLVLFREDTVLDESNVLLHYYGGI